MTDDSIDVKEKISFHPLDTPRGCKYYDFKILTPSQQGHLNDFKANLMRNDEKYLAKNPQIRAIVALVYRHVLKYKPKKNVVKTIANFFNRPIEDIQMEILEYLSTRKIDTSVSETEYKDLWEPPEDYGSYYMPEHQHDTAGSIIDFIREKEVLEEESEDSTNCIAFIRGILEGTIQGFPSDDRIQIQSVEGSQTTDSSLVGIDDFYYDSDEKVEEYILTGLKDLYLEY